MSCKSCGSVAAHDVIVFDGVLRTDRFCTDCAAKTGSFCPTHKSQHLIYNDGTSVCYHCLVEAVGQMRDTKFSRLPEQLGERRDEFLWLIPHPPGTTEFENAAAKLIVTAELRHQMNRAQVLKRLFESDHRHLVLPPVLMVPAQIC